MRSADSMIGFQGFLRAAGGTTDAGRSVLPLL